MPTPSVPSATLPDSSLVHEAWSYWLDAWQRSILLLDVLRQRGNNCAEHNSCTAPHVLSFDAELVLDGRSLPRPVNYVLARIVPLIFPLENLGSSSDATQWDSIVPTEGSLTAMGPVDSRTYRPSTT